jgi:hypothetical protein
MAREDGSIEATPGPSAEAPIAELVQRLTEQATRLAQKEIELAKAEMSAKGQRLGFGIGAFSAAGALALLALGALTAAAILALATAVDGWLAALIVSVVYLGIAGVLALLGRQKVERASPALPEQAMDSVREDLKEAKRRAKEGRE